MQIIQKPCATSNFRAGRQGHKVEGVIIHVIDGTQAGCDATFASNSLALKRSAHYSVGRNGRVHQYVDENDTAFHAGRVQQSTWQGMKQLPGGTFVNPNLYTIGIEHEGRADDEWTDAMYDTTAELMAAIAVRHSIAAYSRQNVGLHREIFSGKSCPGHKFDIARLLAKLTGATPSPIQPSAPAVVRVEKAVRLRQGSPSITAPIHAVLPAGRHLPVIKAVPGDSVNGNNRWYEVETTQFIWAGATDHP